MQRKKSNQTFVYYVWQQMLDIQTLTT